MENLELKSIEDNKYNEKILTLYRLSGGLAGLISGGVGEKVV